MYDVVDRCNCCTLYSMNQVELRYRRTLERCWRAVSFKAYETPAPSSCRRFFPFCICFNVVIGIKPNKTKPVGTAVL